MKSACLSEQLSSEVAWAIRRWLHFTTMPLGTLDKGKANLKEIQNLDSGSSEDTESESDSEDEITPEYLESLLEKARQNVTSISRKSNEEEIIKLDGGSKEECAIAVLPTGCS